MLLFRQPCVQFSLQATFPLNIRTRNTDVVTEAVLGLLHDKPVEELDTAPEIINLLSVSVQNTGKKTLIFDLRHIYLHVFKQNLSAKICIPLRTYSRGTVLSFCSI